MNKLELQKEFAEILMGVSAYGVDHKSQVIQQDCKRMAKELSGIVFSNFLPKEEVKEKLHKMRLDVRNVEKKRTEVIEGGELDISDPFTDRPGYILAVRDLDEKINTELARLGETQEKEDE